MNLTDNASAHLSELFKTEPDVVGLRIGIVGGGCSGFNYTFEFATEETITEDDEVFVSNGTQIVIDPMSIMYLEGCTLDYTKSLAGNQFVVSNPNAQTTCGCGTSFSV